ncbi:MAG: hypothetical protein DYG90_13275, partial [Chloroflexi bacterium CFX6]|nr:hypothetical protein [Chloroflexi bacterium CFX6]
MKTSTLSWAVKPAHGQKLRGKIGHGSSVSISAATPAATRPARRASAAAFKAASSRADSTNSVGSAS